MVSDFGLSNGGIGDDGQAQVGEATTSGNTQMANELINVNPNNINSTIEFLTAMITPALLISATGSLVLSTSTRLGRVVDRVRELEKRLGDLIVIDDKSTIPLYEKRLDTIVFLLDKVTSRSRILQRAMETFY